jgi:hypothetical protein
MKQMVGFSSLGNDLFAEFHCKCPSKRYSDNPVLAEAFKTKIKISGYNDKHFFDVINKEPRELACECGRRYNYRWTSYGVEIEEIE